MRVLSIASVLFLAATSAPVFSAPVGAPAHVHTARKTGVSIPEEEPSSVSSTIGKVATGASVASGILPFIEGAFHDIFGGGGNSSRRDLEAFHELLARADDGSEAISLKNLGKGLSFGVPIITGIASLFEGSSGNSTRRELLELLARDNSTDQSDAFSLTSLLDIGGDIVSGIESLFSGSSSSSQSQRRELLELIARSNVTDASGALNLGSIFKIGTSIISGLGDLFGGSSSSSQQQQRALVPGRIGLVKLPSTVNNPSFLTSILKRDAALQAPSGNSTASDAISVGDILGDIGSVLGLFLKREVNADDSEAISLGNIFNIGKIAGDGLSIASNLFGGFGNGTRRDFAELLARATTDDESDALSIPKLNLGDIANLGSIASSAVSVIEGLFSGHGNSSRRDLVELLARAAAEDESGAFSLPKLNLGDLANIGSIGASAVSVIEGLFGG
ncbi:hypothetical protein PHLGIDRAFT_33270 [Phlebiopsis gigantea 11061_1 CR5-6]|uniref:Uncharacterized protein n=1 Tax=Phlebiopsis gigantea (strain 11061_1 CR5-6) TaxID=745531 RepID=A0A0C3P163_PHLG1|nr:hypothetical protein PHLGIDRAFT_33270 [Phlebiopsis gigantea 11061_1 CR5-6]